MSSRGYQLHSMIVADESQYEWASTDYSKLCIKSGTTIPTGLSASVRATTSHTTGSETDATSTHTFIIPTLFDAVSMIDGVIEGTLKLGALVGAGNPGDYIDVTNASLALRAMDSTGSARTIMADSEIWSGSIQVFEGGALETEQLMYWLDVSDAIVNPDERILVDLTITYTVLDTLSTDDFYAYIYCTLDTDETTITLPFVMV